MLVLNPNFQGGKCPFCPPADAHVGKHIFVIFLSLFVKINFIRGTCSSIEMLKGYMARENSGTAGLKD